MHDTLPPAPGVSSRSNVRNSVPPVLLSALVSLAACQSSDPETPDPTPIVVEDAPPAPGNLSDVSGAPGTSDTPAPPGFRLFRRNTDLAADGSIDEVLTYRYDGSGRMLTQTYAMGALTRTVTHDYDDGRLVTRTDGVFTESFSHDGLRPVGAILRDDGAVSYRHDDAGRLAGVVGKGVGLGESDCGQGAGGGGEPSFEFAYREDGRIGSATETITGLELQIERRADGRIARIVRRGCDGAITEVDVDYDSEGRARGYTNGFPGGGELTVIDRRFEGDRVSAVASSRNRAGEATQEVVTYGYDEQGLRVLERTRIDGVDVALVTYEYEAVGCVSQVSADPSAVLAIEFTSLFLDPGPALGCGYWFDDRESLL